MPATDRDPRHDALMADLTDPQRAAVLHTEGPLLILAAAGSGKTRVITRRIARLLTIGVRPWQILALTFTNKAAGEMRERVERLLADTGLGSERVARALTITTFHSLCARLLRRYAEHARIPGLKSDYSIYDTSDQQSLIKKVIAALNLSTSNWPPRTVLSVISNAKNDLLDAAAFAERASDFRGRQVAKIYTAYERALHQANAVDFDDLLLLTARILKERPEIRAECQARFRYLLIDEYQDTNRAQFQIAAMLAGGGAWNAIAERAGVDPNICVVGDPDQSIYGWRGADINNILDFEKAFPGCTTIKLGENFRSTEPILAVADTLIKHNRLRRDKPLFTSRAGGDKVRVVLCRDEHHEASLIVDHFKRRHANDADPSAAGASQPFDSEHQAPGVPWRSMAVFYRTNALSRVLEDAFRSAGVPYTIARGTAFFDREEIKNCLAYLRVVANPADDVSLERIINTPTRGLGNTSVAAMQVWAADQGEPLLEALRTAASIPGLTKAAQSAAARFVDTLDNWTGAGSFLGAAVPTSLSDLVRRVIEDSGLEAHYKKQAAKTASDADADRLDNLGELISSAAEFEREFAPERDPALSTPIHAEPAAAEIPPPRAGEVPARLGERAEGAADQPEPFDEMGPLDDLSIPTPPLLALLRAYLESVALVADADAVDPAQGAVTLMTLHAAKGLEFDSVAIVGLEEGLLPHSRAAESESDLEEERRLAFVGITRAMRSLTICSARYRTNRGIPERTIASRFLDELPAEHVLTSNQADAFESDEADDDWQDDAPTIRRERSAARRHAAETAVKHDFPPGCLVRHPQFGIGEVLRIEAGAAPRATVKFRQAGTKTLILEYARLTRVG
ncbi:MAG: UvrD-helicase domain-containing protein [Phycisphaerales bacterium]|nr:UvrD-helicase domain-containing protein [Phycisphaerales bacterium]